MGSERYSRNIEDLGPLTAAEAHVLEKSCLGEDAILGEALPEAATEERRVRAALLRYILLGGSEEHPAHEKGVWIEGAWITGQLDLNYCDCRGRLYLHKSSIMDGIGMTGAVLRGLSFEGSRVGNFVAQGLVVKGSVFLRHGFHAAGNVNLKSAEIDGQLACTGGVFEGQGKDALNCQGMKVKGHVMLRDGFRATNRVEMNSAVIGGRLACQGASLSAPDGVALGASGITVEGDMFLTDGFAASGQVDLNGAVISRLECNKARFKATHDRALRLDDARILTSLLWWDVEVREGGVDLRGLRVETLNDRTDAWPEGLRMDGFVYERLAQETGVWKRLDWVGKNQSTDFKPQPYQQLARVLGDLGHRIDRARVLERMEDRIRAHQRAAMPPLSREVKWVWDMLLRAVVGYGYFPSRALIAGICLVVLTTLGAKATWEAGDMTPTAAPVLMSADWQAIAQRETHPGAVWSRDDGPGRDYETFRAVLYGFDAVVPLINLGQEAAWGPSTSRSPIGKWAHVLLPFVKILGWVITAMGAAAVTGAIRRE